MLERTAALVEENNKLLKSIKRSGRWHTVFQVGYWVLIIALTFGALYFIQPYLNSIGSLLGGVSGAAKSQSFSTELQNALKQYQSP